MSIADIYWAGLAALVLAFAAEGIRDARQALRLRRRRRQLASAVAIADDRNPVEVHGHHGHSDAGLGDLDPDPALSQECPYCHGTGLDSAACTCAGGGCGRSWCPLRGGEVPCEEVPW